MFSPLFADRTPIISQTNTKTSFKAWKARRPDIIIGVVWACWLCLWSQPWPEETAYQLMVSGVGKKKTMTKVRGQRWLSSLRVPTATGWWLNRSLNPPVGTKMVSLQFQTRFDPFWPPNLAGCPLRFVSRLPTCLEREGHHPRRGKKITQQWSSLIKVVLHSTRTPVCDYRV